MAEHEKRYILFLDFYLDTHSRTLFRLNGEEVPLKKDATESHINFELLLYFLKNNGQVLSKEELIQEIWGDDGVEDGTLYKHISQLRIVLGCTSEDRIFKNVPRRGYSFIAEKVKTIDEKPSAEAVLKNPITESGGDKSENHYWLLKFWKPYLEPKPTTTILYTHPLFYRHPTERYFVRDQNLNDPDDDTQRVESKIITPGLSPCRHYVSIGEMDCVMRLSRFFGERQLYPACEVEHHKHQWSELGDANMIVIGNVRTNWLVKDTEKKIDAGELEGFDFRMQPHRIVIQNPRGHEQPFYEDLTHSIRDSRNQTVYAVLSRLHSRIPDRWLTVLAANNGWAFKAVAEFITDNDCLKRLAKASGLIEGGSCPERFQILFAVDLDESEQFLGKEARFIAWRL